MTLPIFILALTLTSGLANRPPEPIQVLSPKREGFFSKRLANRGIAILSSDVVADEALYEAQRRLQRMLEHLKSARQNLVDLGAELQIIGKDQVTSDLPEYQDLKGKPFDGKLTVDERTRGLGGRHTSCGEENLLKLPKDRYLGRDICSHEFGHCLMDYGFDDSLRAKIVAQYRASLAKGMWKGSYAASNPSEYFSELTMWYLGTHGDLHMTGAKPDNGPEGLKAFDPDAYALIDKVYTGAFQVARVKWVRLRPEGVAGKGDKSNFWRQVLKVVDDMGQEAKLTMLLADGSKRDLGTLQPKGRSFIEPDPGCKVQIQVGSEILVYAPKGGAETVEVKDDIRSAMSSH